MAPIDQRSLRHQLQQEFPDLEMHDWYVQYRALKASCPDAVLLDVYKRQLKPLIYPIYLSSNPGSQEALPVMQGIET